MNCSKYNLQTEYAQKRRIKCIKSKDHEKNTTRRPRVLSVQSDVAKRFNDLCSKLISR